MRNRMACVVKDAGTVMFGETAVRLPTRAPPGEYHLRTRPSEMGVRVRGSDFPGRNSTFWIPGGPVIERLNSGDSTDFIIDFFGQPLFVEARGEDPLPAKGDHVEIGLTSHCALLYNSLGEVVH